MLTHIRNCFSRTKELQFPNRLMVEGFIPNVAFEHGENRVELGREHRRLSLAAESIAGMCIEGNLDTHTIIDVRFNSSDADHRRIAAYLRLIRDAGDMSYLNPTVHAVMIGIDPRTNLILSDDKMRETVLENLMGREMRIGYRQNKAAGEFRL